MSRKELLDVSLNEVSESYFVPSALEAEGFVVHTYNDETLP